MKLVTILLCAVSAATLAISVPVHAQDKGTSSSDKAPSKSAAPAEKKPSATAEKSGDTKLDRSDRRFIETMARDGHAEVEAGKLAQSKASDDRIKKLGQSMVDDHSKAGKELQKLAAAKGVKLPTGPSKGQQKTLDDLQDKSGADFDKAFMKMALRDHEKAEKLLQKTSREAKDADVKEFASTQLPVIQAHLHTAHEIAPKKERKGMIQKSTESAK